MGAGGSRSDVPAVGSFWLPTPRPWGRRSRACTGASLLWVAARRNARGLAIFFCLLANSQIVPQLRGTRRHTRPGRLQGRLAVRRQRVGAARCTRGLNQVIATLQAGHVRLQRRGFAQFFRRIALGLANRIDWGWARSGQHRTGCLAGILLGLTRRLRRPIVRNTRLDASSIRSPCIDTGLRTRGRGAAGSCRS